MKKIYYSYLLNRERDLKKALTYDGYSLCDLYRNELAAKRARHSDCCGGEYKPGKLVKITLEAIDD